ncbi:ABC transporter ATP-binding protein [Aureimonas mangrovi]|uniref:dipeptide ABC transporter ATP-binding protein n=1 Tax=Aureimonas mangrovi TaxID=2758041 RepID=UPI00163D4266|nr:ABC transporter ATP-binding protein [Aureimonas mangrovi]
MSPLLSVENLSIEFRTLEGRVRAVDDLSFAVQPGRTLALIGESGSGKSVTAHSILGLLPAAAHRIGGRILFRDPRKAETLDLTALPLESAAFQAVRGDRISMVFQEPTAALSPMHTIGEQIGDVLRRHRKLGRREIRAATLDVLREVGFPDAERAADAYSFQLSGGLCQRAMIAIATVCRPALIIADEPTTALDVTVQAEILRLLRSLQAEHGTALLLISHDLGVVASMADEMVVMHHGAAMESGSVHDLFAQPRHPYLRALMRSVPRLGQPSGERLRPLREIRIDDALASFRRRAGASDGSVLLEARGLQRTFPARALSGGEPHHVLRGIDLVIRRHECLGLVGESGSGKTTLSRILARDQKPDAGTVSMAGTNGMEDVLSLRGPALKNWRRRVQYVFQNPYLALDPRMSVEGSLVEPLEIHGIGTARSRRERARELLALVGLPQTHLSRFPHGFSGGQRQRIGIARALALEPELILFDEPVSALDVSVQAQVLNLLRDLKRELGLTYLFVSHNLAVVDYLSDRIAVMCEGRLVEIAPRETLFRGAVHPYTRRLIAAVPEPDPARPIDFEAIGVGQERGRSEWGWPFVGRDGRAEPDLVSLGGGHWVQAFEEGLHTVRTPTLATAIGACEP